MLDIMQLALTVYYSIVPAMDTAVSTNICPLLPADDAFYLLECTHPYEWFSAASIPEELWPEFLAVAACESNFDISNGEGDGGAAKGLFQIHWDLWQPWATAADPEWEDTDWTNPVDNAALAYLIQEEYSLPRSGDRWEQWSAKPHWPECGAKVQQLGFEMGE